MSTLSCDKCGTKYSYKEMKLGFTDKDSYECHICGNTLISWKGGIMYHGFEIIKGPTNPEYQNKEQ